MQALGTADGAIQLVYFAPDGMGAISTRWLKAIEDAPVIAVHFLLSQVCKYFS